MFEQQFSKGYSQYGASMGRKSHGTPVSPAKLFKVRSVDGDYDDGGAYWGGLVENPLFCLRSEDSEHFFRAPTFIAALKEVERQWPGLTLEKSQIDVDIFVEAYATAALWSSTDYETDEPLDKNHSVEDIHEDTMKTMREECIEFIMANEADLLAARAAGLDDDRLGHDFWLTRNHHGVGFWSRDELTKELGERLSDAAHEFGEIDLYVGDDDKIHQ